MTCRCAAGLGALLLGPTPAWAQEAYRQPPSPIPEILNAPRTPTVQVSPDRKWLLLRHQPALPPIDDVAAPELRLAGLRIDPHTNGPSREACDKALSLLPIAGGEPRPLETPPAACVAEARWAPDSRTLAFTVTDARGVALWTADVASGRSRALTEPRLNAALGEACSWVSPTRLACRMIPAGRGPAPEAPAVPAGPVVQESSGRTAPLPTYQDLLTGPADERMLEYYATSQIVLVGLDGALHPLGAPGLHVSVAAAPGGRYLLVQTAHRPYSYAVTLRRFPRRIEIWDAGGAPVKLLADLPLHDEVPIAADAVPAGPRDLRWRDDAPDTLLWAEALDGGDPARPAAKRDRLLALPAPFTSAPVALLDLEYRLSGLIAARDDLMLVTESWRKTLRTRTWALAPARPGHAHVLFDRSSEDRYGDPGDFATAAGPLGTRVLLTSPDGRTAYLTGIGASPEGTRPFLDRFDLATGASRRLWRCEGPYHETVTALLDPVGRRILTRRESASDPPNHFVRELPAGELRPLTHFPDPAPQFAGVRSELIHYTRADGVQLAATLHLPAGYDRSQGPLPFLFWAYPEEFRSREAASQVVGSPYRFLRPTGASPLFMLTQGYGVLEDPSMPIVGEDGREPNDTYVEQLLDSARAAVDAVVGMGVADRGRIAVGGHSYGAFMTANLLAHSNLFRAGIARSGAYNRTLTPFGFQAEDRPFWKARDTYIRMSPFTYADAIDEPLLLIHGQADSNTGTFPIQSERLFAALKGNGGRARLVLLPAESHSYRARESVGQVLWEMAHWLDVHLKAPPAAAE